MRTPGCCMFTDQEIRAIQDGTKTQHRLPVTPQPDEDGLAKLIDGPWQDTSGRSYPCPFGVPGDRYWAIDTDCEMETTDVRVERELDQWLWVWSFRVHNHHIHHGLPALTRLEAVRSPGVLALNTVFSPPRRFWPTTIAQALPPDQVDTGLVNHMEQFTLEPNEVRE